MNWTATGEAMKTIEVAWGAHPKAIQEGLGHTSTRVTLNTYGHLFLALDEALTEDLDEQFQNAISEISQPVLGLTKLSLSA